MNPGLAALIFPLSCEEFLAHHWPQEPLVVHGLRIEPLIQVPFLRSLDTLLNTWPEKIQVHLPDLSDEASSIDATPSDARKLFANEMALLFNNVQKFSPELNNWLDALRSDLGLPAMAYGRCMIYATPHEKGTAPHFDQNINFVLQIYGSKKWWIAPNENVQNPTQRYTIGLPLDGELASYSQTPMPERMPTNASEIVLEPGSMLFVPRGYWHSTEAEGEALALNFTFSQPTWIDLFTMALRSRLSLSPEWRELADGVSSQNSVRREMAEAKFNSLLLELTDDLPNWQAADILAATEGYCVSGLKLELP